MEEKLAKIEKKLRYMIGKSFLYSGLICDVNDFRITKESVFVSTSAKMFVFTHDEFLQKRDDFQELDKPQGIAKKSVQIATLDKDAPLHRPSFLSDTLVDSITRLQSDSSYIKQANAINNTVKTILAIAKTDLNYKQFNLQNKGKEDGKK